jgi:ribosome-associated toxin RatA of RatAB toxin-antitoxin module
MAVSDSKEVVIEASPDQVLDVIADVESSPKYNSGQQSAEIVDTHDDGRPRRVKMKIKSAGISDEIVLDYAFAGDVVSWSLVSAKQLKRQDGKYTLRPEGDKTRVKFELTVDLSVPLPGFVLKRAIKGAMNDATDGLRKYVVSVKKGGS